MDFLENFACVLLIIGITIGVLYLMFGKGWEDDDETP